MLKLINLFIYLIYFYIDAEKPFLGMLNKLYVWMYGKWSVSMTSNSQNYF